MQVLQSLASDISCQRQCCRFDCHSQSRSPDASTDKSRTAETKTCTAIVDRNRWLKEFEEWLAMTIAQNINYYFSDWRLTFSETITDCNLLKSLLLFIYYNNYLLRCITVVLEPVVVLEQWHLSVELSVHLSWLCLSVVFTCSGMVFSTADKDDALHDTCIDLYNSFFMSLFHFLSYFLCTLCRTS